MYRTIDAAATHSVAAALRQTGAGIGALTSRVGMLLPRTHELHLVNRSISWWDVAAGDLERRAAGIESSPSSRSGPEWIQGLPRAEDLEPPSVAAAFFAGLSRPQAEALADRFPDRVGPINGVPPAIRFRANHHLAVRYFDDLQRIRRVLTGTHRGFGWTTEDLLNLLRPTIALPSGWSGAQQLADLDQRIADAERWAIEGHHFLRFDPAGDGKVVEVLGDLETSRHIAVVVPGIANDLSTYERGVRSNATALYETVDRSDAAVIAWLGYDAPDGLIAAAGSRPDTAAESLVQMLAGLAVSLNHDVHTTLIGHSYGSLVVGAALQAGGRADDAVLIGSPGVGADHASDLGSTSSTRVWVGRTGSDPITFARAFECVDLVPICYPSPDRLYFGLDPIDPSFGATPFETGDAPIQDAHSAYFRLGSPALRNLAFIFTGRYDRVTAAVPSP